MHDIIPADAPYWQHFDKCAREVVSAYGYQELRFPVVEKTELFCRAIGEATDIVEKEMYTFTDRNGDSLTLRPEGTASCVRAGIQHGLLHNQVQRLWYLGPMFRHERPQKGRYRQFHQVGIEAFGISGPEIDVELILVAARLFERLGLTGLRLELSSLGCQEERRRYRTGLVDYLRANIGDLDDDSRRRLDTNPLRILDSKNPEMRSLIEHAPKLIDTLGQDSSAHFECVRSELDTLCVPYVVNPRLVRGLDYYTHTVFEWVSDELGAQGTVCGGGRYDGLVAQIGGRATYGAGWAMGIERIISMLRSGAGPVPDTQPHVYFAAVGAGARQRCASIAESLRDQIPQLRLVLDAADDGFKNKLKRADRSGAVFALLLGDDEVREHQITVKPLRDEAAQTVVAQSEIAAHLARQIDA
jgi:histidyl-tRNA synthetase